MTYQQPDAKGFYGKFGGQFVPETLMTAVIELDKAYREAKELMPKNAFVAPPFSFKTMGERDQ